MVGATVRAEAGAAVTDSVITVGLHKNEGVGTRAPSALPSTVGHHQPRLVKTNGIEVACQAAKGDVEFPGIVRIRELATQCHALFRGG